MAPATPLLSACMIVKDEEELLPDCLASLAGAVDEIVIYDTGSTDRTVELAEAAGATVLRGYWDDDFGRARNAALDGCTGRWILHIDADERLEGDPAALRALLARSTADLLDTRIDNIAPDGQAVGFTHYAGRLFLRTRGRWLGRLHEQVVQRQGQPILRSERFEEPHLLHVGYRSDLVEARDKIARNLRVAQAEVDEGAEHVAHALLSLGRALGAAGRLDEALDRLAEARDQSTGEPGVRRQALRCAAQTLLELGRPTEALAWIRDLRQVEGSRQVADYFAGLAHINLGEHATASRLLRGIGDSVIDEDGFRIPASAVGLHRALGFMGQQRWREAAASLLPLLDEADLRVPVWAPVVEATARAGGDVRSLTAKVSREQLTAVLGQMLNVDTDAADSFADALWERWPGSPQLLAFAATVGPRLSVARAMEWSARLRCAGVTRSCPLIALASADDREVLDRLRAAAVAAAGFEDERGSLLLVSLAPLVAVDDLHQALLEVATLAPTCVPAFVEAGAVGADRCLSLAQSLHAFGADGEALAVFEHGWGHAGPHENGVDDAVQWLRGVGQHARADRLLAAS